MEMFTGQITLPNEGFQGETVQTNFQDKRKDTCNAIKPHRT